MLAAGQTAPDFTLADQDGTPVTVSDLRGKTVVLTRGTVQADAIPRLAERQQLGIKFVTGGDHHESFRILASGKADAFANDDVQLFGMMAET
ncbi:MAG: transporter substrate-binding domain-containing protein, partial [Solirubrobacterales bacterium]